MADPKTLLVSRCGAQVPSRETLESEALARLGDDRRTLKHIEQMTTVITSVLADLELLGFTRIGELCTILRHSEAPSFTETSLVTVCCLTGAASQKSVLVSDGGRTVSLAHYLAPFAIAYWIVNHWQQLRCADDILSHKRQAALIADAHLCAAHTMLLTLHNANMA